MLRSHKPPKSGWTEYQNVTQDFDNVIDSDLFSVVPISRPIKLVSLGRKIEPPSDEELFSGEFSLLPVEEDDLEEKHVIGAMDRITCAVATWIQGNASVRETICRCLYMRLTDDYVKTKENPVETKNTLGTYLLLFVEGVRRFYGMAHGLTCGNGYSKDFVQEDNPLPQAKLESYRKDLDNSIDQLSKKVSPTEFDKAILIRLSFVKGLELILSMASGERPINLKELKDNLPKLEVNEYINQFALGEEPIGSFFDPDPESESSHQLVSLDNAINTLTELQEALLDTIKSSKSDPIRLAYINIVSLHNGPDLAPWRALVPRAVTRMALDPETLRAHIVKQASLEPETTSTRGSREDASGAESPSPRGSKQTAPGKEIPSKRGSKQGASVKETPSKRGSREDASVKETTNTRGPKQAVSGAEIPRDKKPSMEPDTCIKIYQMKTNDSTKKILEDINKCWESTLGLLNLNDESLYAELPQCISKWADLHERSNKERPIFKQGTVYIEHVKSFITIIYIILGHKLGLYVQNEYRFTLWILVNMYKRMIPEPLQAQEPKDSSAPEFGMNPDSAFYPPLPRDLKQNAKPFNHGNVIFSNSYLTYLMFQQLSMMGELTLHRGLLSNTLIREKLSREKLEKLFKYRMASIKFSSFEKPLTFDTFLRETDFYRENFDVLYKRSIGYFEKSLSLLETLKTSGFTDIFALNKTVELNKERTRALLRISDRGLPSFIKKNRVQFEPKDTILPILTIKD